MPPYFAEVVVYAKEPNEILLKVDEYLIVGEENKVNVELYWNKHLLKGQTKDYRIVTDLPFDSAR